MWVAVVTREDGAGLRVAKKEKKESQVGLEKVVTLR